MDRKIKEEFEQRTKMNAEFIQERENKRKELMLKTKDFQTKQVLARQVIENSDKKKQWDEYEQDLKQLEKVDKTDI